MTPRDADSGTTVVPSEVAGLLRDLHRVRDLPADDPQRQAWAARKRDVISRIEDSTRRACILPALLGVCGYYAPVFKPALATDRTAGPPVVVGVSP